VIIIYEIKEETDLEKSTEKKI